MINTPIDGLSEAAPESLTAEERRMQEIYMAEIVPMIEKIKEWCGKYHRSSLFVCEYSPGLSGLACSTSADIGHSMLLLQMLAGTGGDIDAFIMRARAMFEHFGLDATQVNVFNAMDSYAKTVMLELVGQNEGSTTH